MKIFIDDRCPLYGAEFLRQYDDARRVDPRQIDIWQRKYDFRYAMVEPGTPFDLHLQRSGRWTLLGRCAAGALYQIHL